MVAAANRGGRANHRRANLKMLGVGKQAYAAFHLACEVAEVNERDALEQVLFAFGALSSIDARALCSEAEIVSEKAPNGGEVMRFWASPEEADDFRRACLKLGLEPGRVLRGLVRRAAFFSEAALTEFAGSAAPKGAKALYPKAGEHLAVA